MKKLVRTNLTNTPSRRGTKDLNIQLYSHDKNNAGFEFVIKNEVDLSQYKARALFDFRETDITWETTGTIEGNVVKVKFDTDLISKCEEVIGYLFLDRETDSLDIFKFKFTVILSEIDKQEVGKRGFRYIKDEKVIDVITRSELEEELKKLQINGGIDLNNYLTTSVAEATYVKKTDLPTSYNDSALSQRVTNLENKADKDTVYDDSDLRNRVKALEDRPTTASTSYDDSEVKRRLTDLEGRPTGTTYNDKPLSDRVSALENKQDSDTVYDDSKLVERVKKLEDKPEIDTSHFLTEEILAEKHFISASDVEQTYLKKVDVPTPVNTSKFITDDILTAKNLVTKDELNTLKPNQTLSLTNGVLSISGGNNVTLPASQYEIHGTGMPNGVVEAEIGTTYIDKNKTNGAFKWIKTTNGGNQGWEVLTGDTGWRTLNSVSKLGNSFVKVRRVNNEVTYQFGGLSWGWFGIVRRGGTGYVTQTTDTERNCFIVGEHGIPAGFRTPNSLIGSIYNDRGIAYGTWYVGNGGDANHLRFQFLNPVPTDSDIGDIRVSQISYLTDEPWPTQLP